MYQVKVYVHVQKKKKKKKKKRTQPIHALFMFLFWAHPVHLITASLGGEHLHERCDFVYCIGTVYY